MIFKKAGDENNNSQQKNPNSGQGAAPTKTDAGSAFNQAVGDPNVKKKQQADLKIGSLKKLAADLMISEKKLKVLEGSLTNAKDFMNKLEQQSNIQDKNIFVFNDFCTIASSIAMGSFFGVKDIDSAYNDIMIRIQACKTAMQNNINMWASFGTMMQGFMQDPDTSNAITESSDPSLKKALELIGSETQKKSDSATNKSAYFKKNKTAQTQDQNQGQGSYILQAFQVFIEAKNNDLEKFKNDQFDLLGKKRLVSLSGTIQDLQMLAVKLCPVEKKYKRFKKMFGAGIPTQMFGQLIDGADAMIEIYQKMKTEIVPGTIGDQAIGQDEVVKIQQALDSSIAQVESYQNELESELISSYYGVNVGK